MVQLHNYRHPTGRYPHIHLLLITDSLKSQRPLYMLQSVSLLSYVEGYHS